LEVLENLYKVTIEYWAVDKSNNESKHYVLEINVKDTIAPVIDGVHDIQIADEDLLLYLNNHHLLEQDLEISDNLNNKLELKITYYDNNKIINEDAFFKNLKRGIGGNIIYQVIDSFGNKSEEVFQKVSVIDDTPPIITINNLENRKQYLGPVNIDYVIEDNSLVSFKVTTFGIDSGVVVPYTTVSVLMELSSGTETYPDANTRYSSIFPVRVWDIEIAKAVRGTGYLRVDYDATDKVYIDPKLFIDVGVGYVLASTDYTFEITYKNLSK
jgi:hypothetical protein